MDSKRVASHATPIHTKPNKQKSQTKIEKVKKKKFKIKEAWYNHVHNSKPGHRNKPKKKKVQAAPTKSETKIPLQTDYTEYKHTTSRLATRELN